MYVRCFEVRKSFRRVELLTWQALPGRGLVDADALKGSFIAHTVSWGGGHEVAVPAAGGTVVVHLEMEDASFYALQFRCGGLT